MNRAVVLGCGVVGGVCGCAGRVGRPPFLIFTLVNLNFTLQNFAFAALLLRGASAFFRRPRLIYVQCARRIGIGALQPRRLLSHVFLFSSGAAASRGAFTVLAVILFVHDIILNINMYLTLFSTCT